MRARFLLLALGILAAPLTVRAQGLQVAPVTVELSAGQMLATMTVSNRLPDASGMQVRSFAWTQDASGDKLAPTNALDVSPPIFDIAGGATQLVRVVLRKPPSGREEAYRILFDQLPSASTPGGIKLALRFSVPVFAAPGAAIASDLSLRIEATGGIAQLVADNRGTRHDRILAPVLTFSGGNLSLAANTNYYVLAGSEQRWSLAGRLAALHGGMNVQLKAASLTGPLDKTVAVTGP